MQKFRPLKQRVRKGPEYFVTPKKFFYRSRSNFHKRQFNQQSLSRILILQRFYNYRLSSLKKQIEIFQKRKKLQSKSFIRGFQNMNGYFAQNRWSTYGSSSTNTIFLKCCLKTSFDQNTDFQVKPFYFCSDVLDYKLELNRVCHSPV